MQLWRQQRWANNKGAFDIEDAGVRVFAFREAPIPGTRYRVVDPRQIVEIKGARVEVNADYALGALHCSYERFDDVEEIARAAVEAAAQFDNATGLPMTLYSVELISE